MPKTRSYKLRLSPTGLAHFLRCHCRLAALLGELVPYGATLYVAVALLAEMQPQERAGEPDIRSCQGLAGNRIYFVGFSHALAQLTERVRTGAVGIAADLSVARIYLLGLLAFDGADDEELLRAYRTCRRE